MHIEHKPLDLSLLFSDHPAVSWTAVTGAASIITGFIIRFRKISASLERTRIRTAAEALASEAAERAAFRETLMAEIGAVRSMIKECETDRDTLRGRLNTAEGQILILQASNEITEKWVAFFREAATAKAIAASGHSPE